MASGQLNAFIRRLRRVVRPTESDGPSDAQLLHRFVQGRDEEAFELLVWRHGAMVLNVCRRVLRREHDSEDAFQATFLTLVRKAGTIGKRASLGSWLYKVAYRIALRARDDSPSRPLPEGRLSDPSSGEPIHDLAWREVGAALDEEIQRLPEKYRAALVLCHLEGRTIESAARTLDCPPGTVGTWLARARGLLRRRLAHRGFDLSSVMEARNVAALLSAALVNATVRAAAFTTAEKAAAGVVSAAVAELTKGALRAMTLTRWTTTTVLVLTLSLLGGAGSLIAHRASILAPAQAAEAMHPHRPSRGEKKTAAVLFQWKFQKSRPFYQVYSTTTRQTMKVMNNDVTQVQNQTIYFQLTPEKKVDGQWIIAQKILGVKVDIDIGGNPMKYDSTRAEDNSASNPLSTVYKALVGAEFKLVLDAKTLEVVRLEGHEEFVRRLGAANEQMKPLIDKVLSEAVFKETAETCFASRLMSPARPGDSWNKRRKMEVGVLGTYQIDSRYKYVGTECELDRIKVEGSLIYRLPPRQDGVGGLPFRMEKGALGGNETGVLLFDRSRGRLARAELNQKLSGKLTVLIGGQKTTVELLQTQQTTVQTMDANPLIEIERLRAELKRENEWLRRQLPEIKRDVEQLRRQLQAMEEALRREDKLK